MHLVEGLQDVVLGLLELLDTHGLVPRRISLDEAVDGLLLHLWQAVVVFHEFEHQKGASSVLA